MNVSPSIALPQRKKATLPKVMLLSLGAATNNYWSLMEGWIFIRPHSLTSRMGTIWAPMEAFDATVSLLLHPLFNPLLRETNTESSIWHHSPRRPTNNLMASWLYWKGPWLILTGINIYLVYGFASPILRTSVSTTIWRHMDGVLDPPT